MKEQEIIEKLKSEGYQKVYVWDAEPGEFDEEHKHDFDTKLVIITGEIQIRTAVDSFLSNTLYKSGSEVVIPRHQPHEAKVGSKGCRCIVAEKH
ncbi:MAG: cupin [Parcubacteria group bacterium Gr01-1014_56]|nr:MAG: cupin [Parcubacteria group bacterium Gr01-1014_56]